MCGKSSCNFGPSSTQNIQLLYLAYHTGSEQDSSDCSLGIWQTNTKSTCPFSWYDLTAHHHHSLLDLLHHTWRDRIPALFVSRLLSLPSKPCSDIQSITRERVLFAFE